MWVDDGNFWPIGLLESKPLERLIQVSPAIGLLFVDYIDEV